MTTEERYKTILRNHLPADRVERDGQGVERRLSAVDWVYSYAERYKLNLHVKQERRSKLGDYRWPQPRHNYHEISVNGNLNPYMFLWVFLHEAAHLETHMRYTEKVPPHGHEWQAEHAKLLLEMTDYFPAEVRPVIKLYASRIPLVRATGRKIETMLRSYDPGNTGETALKLDDLPAGSLFRLKSKPEILFRSEMRRRTRWLCTAVDSGRRYTVNGEAEIVKAEVVKEAQ